MYQTSNGDEFSKYLLGEVRILEVPNGRLLMEQVRDRLTGQEIIRRRTIEGYVHTNDKNEDRLVILERNKDGKSVSKKIVGCLRNLYNDGVSYVIEEWLTTQGAIKSRYIYGHISFCRQSDLGDSVAIEKTEEKPQRAGSSLTRIFKEVKTKNSTVAKLKKKKTGVSKTSVTYSSIHSDDKSLPSDRNKSIPLKTVESSKPKPVIVNGSIHSDDKSLPSDRNKKIPMKTVESSKPKPVIVNDLSPPRFPEKITEDLVSPDLHIEHHEVAHHDDENNTNAVVAVDESVEEITDVSSGTVVTTTVVTTTTVTAVNQGTASQGSLLSGKPISVKRLTQSPQNQSKIESCSETYRTSGFRVETEPNEVIRTSQIMSIKTEPDYMVSYEVFPDKFAKKVEPTVEKYNVEMSPDTQPDANANQDLEDINVITDKATLILSIDPDLPMESKILKPRSPKRTPGVSVSSHLDSKNSSKRGNSSKPINPVKKQLKTEPNH